MITELVTSFSDSLDYAELDLSAILSEYPDLQRKDITKAFLRDDLTNIPPKVASLFTKITTLARILNELQYLPAIPSDWTNAHYLVAFAEDILAWEKANPLRITNTQLHKVLAIDDDILFNVVLAQAIKRKKHGQTTKPDEETSVVTRNFDDDPEAA